MADRRYLGEKPNPNYEANGPLTKVPSLGAEINKAEVNRRRRRKRQERAAGAKEKARDTFKPHVGRQSGHGTHLA